jgi:hypothetical protein
MTDFEPEEDLPPVAHVTLVYNGPVAPHWEMKPRYGDQKMLDDFWTRVHARLLLLPKHDPQFRRNRERVNRDAERERIICDWDLGEDDAESTSTPSAMAPAADHGDAAEAAPQEAPTQDAAEEVSSEAPAEEAVAETAEDAAVDDSTAEDAAVEDSAVEGTAVEDAAPDAEDAEDAEEVASDEAASEMPAGQA